MDGLVTATLLASHSAVRAGQGVVLALQLQIAPGWYVYWDNPGDSGIPTRVDLQAPELELERVWWPAPTEIPAAGGILNLGHKEQLTLLVPATVRPGSGERLEVNGEARWLVCRADQCVPGEAALHLELKRERGKPGRGRPQPVAAPIDEALANLPPAVVATVEAGVLRAQLPTTGEVRLYPGLALLDLLPVEAPPPFTTTTTEGGTALRLLLSGLPSADAFAIALVSSPEGPRAFTLVLEPPR